MNDGGGSNGRGGGPYSNGKPGSASRFEFDFRAASKRYFENGFSSNDGLALDVGTFADLAATEPPPLVWLVDNLIPPRTVTLLTGDGGTGKTLLAMQLMIAIVSGTYWLGTRAQQGRAFAMFCEDDKDTLHRRVAALARRLKVLPDQMTDAYYVSRAGDDTMLYGPSIEDPRVNEFTMLYYAIRKNVLAYRPTIVIVDTVADVFGANEFARPAVREFIQQLRAMCLDIDCACVLCAHPSVSGMTSERGYSGSTAWHNSVRSRLYLTADAENDDVKVLRGMKNNYGPKVNEIRLRYSEGAFMPELEDTGMVAQIEKKAQGKAIVELVAATAAADNHLSSSPNSQARYLPYVAGRRIKGMTAAKAKSIMNDLLFDRVIEEATIDKRRGRRGLIRSTEPGPLTLTPG